MKPINIPSSFTPEQRQFVNSLVLELNREFQNRTPKNEASDKLLLLSPSRKVYALSVSDAGAVVAELVSE